MSRYVYFIKPVGLPGPIKIGTSTMPANRLISLSTWSPIPLELITTIPGDHKLERNIQDCFADVHSHREWFHPVDRLMDAIRQIKAGVPVDEAIDLKTRRGSIVPTRLGYRKAAA